MAYLSLTSFVPNLGKFFQQIVHQVFFWITFTYPPGYLNNKLNVWHMLILYSYESHVLISLKTILWYLPLLSFQASFVIRDSHVTQFQSVRYKLKSNWSFWKSFHSPNKEGSYSWHYPFPLLSALTATWFLESGPPTLFPKRSKNKGKAKRLWEMPTITTQSPWIKSSYHHQPLNFLCEKISHLFKPL